MRRVIASVALALLMVGGKAEAQAVSVYMSGEALTSACRGYLNTTRNSNQGSLQDVHDSGLCYGYVVGIYDTVQFENSQVSRAKAVPEICIPGGVNAKSITEVVANYLNAHPESRHKTGYFLVRTAIAAAWPCTNR